MSTATRRACRCNRTPTTTESALASVKSRLSTRPVPVLKNNFFNSRALGGQWPIISIADPRLHGPWPRRRRRGRRVRSTARDRLDPALLMFPSHCRAGRVLRVPLLDAAPGDVARVLALRDDALQAHPAGPAENRRAVALDVPQVRASTSSPSTSSQSSSCRFGAFGRCGSPRPNCRRRRPRAGTAQPSWRRTPGRWKSKAPARAEGMAPGLVARVTRGTGGRSDGVSVSLRSPFAIARWDIAR